jgi:hypothetical protein
LDFRGRLLLLLPLLVVLIAVIGWPLLDTVWLSFTNTPLGGITGEFVGLANYLHAFRSPACWRALGVTALFTVFTVGIEMMLGLAVGLLLDMDLRGQRFMRALLIVPWALPTVVNAMAWRVIYNPDFGALDALLQQLGLIDQYKSWLGDPATALFAIGVADIWKTFSLVALITLAGFAERIARSARGGGDRRRRSLQPLPRRDLADHPTAADHRRGAAHHRGGEGVRHHLGHDPGRAARQHQIPQHPGLSAGLLLPPCRLWRLAGHALRRPHGDPDRRLYQGAASPGEGLIR